MAECDADWGFCAAYGCPLFGVYGSGGKWYCCCHHDADASRNDAITLELGKHQPLVDQILSMRRAGNASAELEDKLLELMRGVAPQAPAVPTAPVIGPTHAMAHYLEEL